MPSYTELGASVGVGSLEGSLAVVVKIENVNDLSPNNL